MNFKQLIQQLRKLPPDYKIHNLVGVHPWETKPVNFVYFEVEHTGDSDTPLIVLADKPQSQED